MLGLHMMMKKTPACTSESLEDSIFFLIKIITQQICKASYTRKDNTANK